MQHAARARDMSYRHAWGLITSSAEFFGAPLVDLERGRGATLTAFGEALLELDRKAARELEPRFERLEQELAKIIGQHAAPAVPALIVHASHDLALEYLRDLARDSCRLQIELHTRGSLESLESLAHGTCGMAGFHAPAGAVPETIRRCLGRLKSKALQLINFLERQQGLVVARGNPRNIAGLRELTRRGVRFVNRQPGSGTRLLLDQLLAAAGVRPGSINGYQREEFTHAAVAAMIASGKADAGLAIEAAARDHGLDFVPLARERYYLALRGDLASGAARDALLALLRSRRFKAHAGSLPGYDVRGCGTPATLATAVPA